VKMYARHEMQELVVVDGKARGIIAKNLVTGEFERHSAHAVLLCTGGYGNVFFLSTNAMGSNVTAAWKAHRKGAYMANPCFTQIHPTCIPVSGENQSKLTLMKKTEIIISSVATQPSVTLCLVMLPRVQRRSVVMPATV
jgi:succinate dehydrogenase / fumarate reductase flavoprotein subunit